MNSEERLVYTKKYFGGFKEEKPHKIVQLLNWTINSVKTSEDRITGVDSEGNVYDFTDWGGSWGESGCKSFVLLAYNGTMKVNEEVISKDNEYRHIFILQEEDIDAEYLKKYGWNFDGSSIKMRYNPNY